MAKPDYSSRLAADWQAQAEKDAQEAAARAADAEQGARVQHVLPPKPAATMRMPRREGKKVGLVKQCIRPRTCSRKAACPSCWSLRSAHTSDGRGQHAWECKCRVAAGMGQCGSGLYVA